MAAIGIGAYVPTLPEVVSAYVAAAGQIDVSSQRSRGETNGATAQGESSARPSSAQCVRPNVVPVYKEFIADLETPVSTFLKVRAHGRASRSATSKYCFLLESVEGGERLARYSFVGASPYEVLSVGNGPGYQHSGDPLKPLEAIMSKHKILNVPSVKLPPFTGGAVGYVSYDCVRHFEPKTSMAFEHQEDTLQIPEACFMLCDTLVIFDHVRHTIKIVAHARIPEGCSFLQDDGATPSFELSDSYAAACERIEILYARLNQPIPADDVTPMPATLPQPPPSPGRTGVGSPPVTAVAASDPSDVGGGALNNDTNHSSSADRALDGSAFDWQRSSNVGQGGYETMVRSLKSHIVDGDIIQAVPSQRITRQIPEGNSTSAFDIYRQLRVVNPSPYMFYLELGEGFQIVGASPEMLCKVDNTNGTIYTHPIAGTRRRGATPEEDDALAADLLADAKERAEHIMLVDLGRNDIGRVAEPGTVHVDSLMHIEKYSHVMHIVSNVSGKLAHNRTAYDAFRSIFPAGTVSGAPKVMAVELVAQLEPQRRGVYAGAVGYVGYSGVMDTAIAIRTLVVRGRAVHLQAGAGIVFDSIPTAEYEETISKLRATMRAVDAAIAAGEQRRMLHAAAVERAVHAMVQSNMLV